MFYKAEVMQSRSFKKPWGIAHGMYENSEDNVSITSMCEELHRWIPNDSAPGSRRRRLALRPSSTLLAGVTMMYRLQLDRLLADCKDLDNEVSDLRGTREKMKNGRITSREEESNSEESVRTPEQMMRQLSEDHDVYINTPTRSQEIVKRRRVEFLEPSTNPARKSLELSRATESIQGEDTSSNEVGSTGQEINRGEGDSSIEVNSTGTRSKGSSSHEVDSTGQKDTKGERGSRDKGKDKKDLRGEEDTRNKENTRFEESSRGNRSLSSRKSIRAEEDSRKSSQIQKNRKQKKTRDKCFQTSFEGNGQIEDAEDLPYGIMLIHNNHRSKVPSKLIVSNLNPKAKNLRANI